MKIDGYTRMAAVIARPIRHSISPFIHNLAYELTDTNAVYLAWDIAGEDLKSTISQIRHLDMLGANISMPYKQKVLPFLDKVDDLALTIGSVNTIVQKDGKLKGYNTDGLGFFRSLPNDFSIQGKNLVLLGAGGAALAIIAQAIKLGVKQITVFVRKERLKYYQATLEGLEKAFGFSIQLGAIENDQDLQASFDQADLILNATGVGMDGHSLPIGPHLSFPPHAFIADMAYYPAATPFLKLGREQGNRTLNGLGMLFYQAQAAFEYMTGKVFPTESVWEALTTEYRQFVCE